MIPEVCGVAVDENPLAEIARGRLAVVRSIWPIAAVDDEQVAAAEDRAVAVGREGAELPLQLVRAPEIIRIEERHPCSGCGIDAAIARGGGSASLGLPQHAQAGIGQVHGLGGAIVDNDNLVRRKRLRERALDRGGGLRRAVTGRNDDRDGAAGRHGAIRFRQRLVTRGASSALTKPARRTI